MGGLSCCAASSVVVILVGAAQVFAAQPAATSPQACAFVAPSLSGGPLTRALRLRSSGLSDLKCQGGC